MQDIIARALALRNNSSSSGASAELAQKVQKIEDEYVRATDEKDIEEISSSIEAIKQEIEDKGAEVKASLDSNSAIKAIRPLSEIVNYGGKYAVTGASEFARITSKTKADGIVFIAGVAREGIAATTIQFWDSNKKAYNIGIGLYAMIHNDGSSIHVSSNSGSMRIDYNADGTFKTADTANLYIGRGHVLDKYNTAEYTPTADYHPATKKYVDTQMDTAISKPMKLFTPENFKVFLSSSESSDSDVMFARDVVDLHLSSDTTQTRTIGLESLMLIKLNDTMATVTLLYTGEHYLCVQYDESNSQFVYTAYTKGYASTDKVLTITNTNEYTPTADYHPATKKYVDDSLSAVSTTINDTISALVATDEEFDEAMKG